MDRYPLGVRSWIFNTQEQEICHPSELITDFPSDTTIFPVNTNFPDENLFYIPLDDPWYGDILVFLWT